MGQIVWKYMQRHLTNKENSMFFLIFLKQEYSLGLLPSTWVLSSAGKDSHTKLLPGHSLSDRWIFFSFLWRVLFQDGYSICRCEGR